MSHGVVNANRASCNFSFAASFTNGHQFPSRKSINVIRLLSRETLIKCTRALLLNASGMERNNGTIIVKKCINSKQILKPEREREIEREREEEEDRLSAIVLHLNAKWILSVFIDERRL